MSQAEPPPPTYQCQRCTNCCRWPGFVPVSPPEITRLAGHLSLDELTFIERFTTLSPDRQGLALLNQPDGACIFLEGRDCVVQAVKPVQCSGFPNTWNFPGWQKVCAAVPVEEGTETLG